MRKAIYPGSFDPITNGHLDVIRRAARLFDEVIVAIAVNAEKVGNQLFTEAERIAMIEDAVTDLDNVSAVSFSGLVVDFAKANDAAALIRGLRAVSDFEYEFQMALMNRKLSPQVETMFLMPREDYIYLSSRLVKEIAGYGGDITDFVPENVKQALLAKLGEK